eukprot:TRINITY_DN13250_c0_g1_i1.p1 TRINITY_DN13250_c0_g1~~TRINITY_DN13250_c0_g1_i1.p1  ORF type:complete len:379 (-),score=41.09 TRINITY_DN13250_c0_g1_i1:50-1186(-)
MMDYSGANSSIVSCVLNQLFDVDLDQDAATLRNVFTNRLNLDKLFVFPRVTKSPSVCADIPSAISVKGLQCVNLNELWEKLCRSKLLELFQRTGAWEGIKNSTISDAMVRDFGRILTKDFGFTLQDSGCDEFVYQCGEAIPSFSLSNPVAKAYHALIQKFGQFSDEGDEFCKAVIALMGCHDKATEYTFVSDALLSDGYLVRYDSSDTTKMDSSEWSQFYNLHLGFKATVPEVYEQEHVIKVEETESFKISVSKHVNRDIAVAAKRIDMNYRFDLSKVGVEIARHYGKTILIPYALVVGADFTVKQSGTKSSTMERNYSAQMEFQNTIKITGDVSPELTANGSNDNTTKANSTKDRTTSSEISRKSPHIIGILYKYTP